MKAEAFIISVFLFLSHSLSAQIKIESKSDSIKIGYALGQKILNDTLKLENPFKENNVQSLYKNSFSKTGQNLAQNYHWGYRYPNYKMPIAKPNFKSNMPVAKPDSSSLYFIQIKKTGK